MKRISQDKDKFVLRIPSVLGIRPIVVQPQAIIVPVQVENVRVAITVSYVRNAIHATAQVIRQGRKLQAVYYSGSKILKHHIPS